MTRLFQSIPAPALSEPLAPRREQPEPPAAADRFRDHLADERDRTDIREESEPTKETEAPHPGRPSEHSQHDAPSSSDRSADSGADNAADTQDATVEEAESSAAAETDTEATSPHQPNNDQTPTPASTDEVLTSDIVAAIEVETEQVSTPLEKQAIHPPVIDKSGNTATTETEAQAAVELNADNAPSDEIARLPDDEGRGKHQVERIGDTAPKAGDDDAVHTTAQPERGAQVNHTTQAARQTSHSNVDPAAGERRTAAASNDDSDSDEPPRSPTQPDVEDRPHRPAVRGIVAALNTESQSLDDRSRPQTPQTPSQAVSTDSSEQVAETSTNQNSTSGETTAGRKSTNVIQSLLGRGEQAGQTDSLTQAQRTQLINRVARAVESAVARNESVVRLRLHPPQLGSLRLEIQTQSGALAARLEVETNTAREVLLENLVVLRQRLSEQDIRIEHFDVELNQQRHGNQPGSAGSKSQQDAPRQHDENNAANHASDEESSSDRAGVTRTNHDLPDGAIDVTV